MSNLGYGPKSGKDQPVCSIIVGVVLTTCFLAIILVVARCLYLMAATGG